MAELAAMQSSSFPIPPTRLIGREAELALACAFLRDEAVPVLTLTGPGGSGKTRLALAIAQEVAGHFADGVAWVDLATLANPLLAPATVAQALGMTPIAGLPIEDQLVRRLCPRQSLLLLDNCEHLLPATADLAATLLAACPAVQILATSRASLHLRGEQALPVEPFPLPAAGASPDMLFANDAVRLFVERTHAVDPRFTLSEANAATVAAICRHLDGLPLAIELAAVRMKLLSPETLLAQMGGRLLLLRGGARDLPARQRTIHDTIAWSYNPDALDERTGSAMWPNDRILAEWCLARIEDDLDPATLGRLRHNGMSAAVEEAVATCQMVASAVIGNERAAALWQATGAPDPGAAPAELALAFVEDPPGGDIAAGRDDLTRRERAPLEEWPAQTGLTPRERDVLLELIDGYSDREIAARLFISRRTASKHVEAILAKLGVRSRGAAVAEARRRGMEFPLSPDRTP